MTSTKSRETRRASQLRRMDIYGHQPRNGNWITNNYANKMEGTRKNLPTNSSLLKALVLNVQECFTLRYKELRSALIRRGVGIVLAQEMFLGGERVFPSWIRMLPLTILSDGEGIAVFVRKGHRATVQNLQTPSSSYFKRSRYDERKEIVDLELVPATQR
ncbi:hypothetical protein PoB_001086400 [Plakobranchus ocellatus]|uniref:Uncharacterized protein n=1 Tax=Plakobranchus ocellatus TaxID=259542 RepID=A0AAV3YMX1_9GAST|nr:hypothetical protein PoB_001086400 [Plakobranchus ocellatus]